MEETLKENTKDAEMIEVIDPIVAAEIKEVRDAGKQLKEVALAIKKENDLVKSEATSIFNPVVFTQLKILCESLVRGKALPKGIETGDQALVLMQTGFEMGLKPMESVQSLYMVNGRTQLWGRATLTALTRRGYKLKWIESTNEKAVVEVTKGEEKYIGEFTIERATTEGRLEKEGSLWKKYPKNFLRYNAVREVLNFDLPHIIGSNIYIEGDEEVIDSPVALDRVKERRNRMKNN